MVSTSPRIAVIGIGGFGKNHVRILSDLGCLAAVCDLDAPRAKEIAAKYRVNAYSSIEDLLTERLDACLVCTPTRTHAGIATKIMQRGINAFVEKPLSFSVKECQEMMRVAKEKAVVLTSGYIERFNPAVSEARSLIQGGQYGEPMMIEFHRENRMPAQTRDVGIIYELSVHDIDAAMYLFNSRPTTVFARAGKHIHDYEDFATIMLGFDGQKVAVIASNWITPNKVRRFSAVCTDGIITGDFMTQEVRIDQADSTVLPRRAFQEPLRLELENFISAVEGKSEIVIKAADATEVTRVAEAALESSNSGKPVLLKQSSSMNRTTLLSNSLPT